MSENSARACKADEAFSGAGLIVYQTSTGCALNDNTDQATCTKRLSLGVTTETAASGKDTNIVVRGLAKCLAGASVAINDRIIAEVSTARGIPFATSGLSNNDVVYIVGFARSAASDGGFFDLDVCPQTSYYGA